MGYNPDTEVQLHNTAEGDQCNIAKVVGIVVKNAGSNTQAVPSQAESRSSWQYTKAGNDPQSSK
jgi:hypothetical protein